MNDGDLIKVLVACGNGILCKGIAKILTEEPKITVIGELNSGQEVINKIDSMLPDIVVIEFYLPELNGVDVAQRIKKKYQNIKFIMFSTSDLKDKYIFEMLKTGVEAILDKNSTYQELIIAINAVHFSESYLSPSISSKLIKSMFKGSACSGYGDRFGLERLTQREREVIQLIAEGFSCRQISDKLCISQKTVRNHKANLMKKLNLRNVAEITKYAIQNNVVLM